MLPTTYAPDHIHICSPPHPHMLQTTYAPHHIRICSRPHPHMLQATSTYALYHIHICSLPHHHMLSTTSPYAPQSTVMGSEGELAAAFTALAFETFSRRNLMWNSPSS